MSQINGIRCRTHDLLNAGEDEMKGRSLSPIAPSFGSSYDTEDDHNHPVKKSVLSKVKEKARRWRQTLIKKKQGQDGGNTTPAWGVSLEEDEDDDVEYHGAPMYESELALDEYKEAATRHPSPPPVFTEKQVAAKIVPEETIPTNNDTSSKTLTETVTDTLAPVYNMVSEATQKLVSKIQGQPAATGPVTTEEPSSRPRLEKSLSVKEYLMRKLEPGAEERALSRVISDVMAAKKVTDNREIGVVEKMKGAMSSFLGVKEPASSITSASPNNPHAETSSSIAPVAPDNPHAELSLSVEPESPKIPHAEVSLTVAPAAPNNPHAGVAEELQEKRRQANTNRELSTLPQKSFVKPTRLYKETRVHATHVPNHHTVQDPSRPSDETRNEDDLDLK